MNDALTIGAPDWCAMSNSGEVKSVIELVKSGVHVPAWILECSISQLQRWANYELRKDMTDAWFNDEQDINILYEALAKELD